jgi:hypothetical protein
LGSLYASNTGELSDSVSWANQDLGINTMWRGVSLGHEAAICDKNHGRFFCNLHRYVGHVFGAKSSGLNLFLARYADLGPVEWAPLQLRHDIKGLLSIGFISGDVVC